jgi:hypothetical protein
MLGGWSQANGGGITNNGNPGANLWSKPVHLYGVDNSVEGTVSFDYIGGSNSGKAVSVEIFITNDNMSNLVWAGQTTIHIQNTGTQHVVVNLDGKMDGNQGWWPEGDYNIVVVFAFPPDADLNDKTVIMKNDFVVAYPTALPVTFAGFTANRSVNGILLNWITASEQHNSYFVIEKSTDGKNFTEVGRVNTQASGGNSSHTLNYQFFIPSAK